MVQLGRKAPPEQYPPVEMLEYAITAEQAGFDTLEASDHFQPWSEAGQASFVWTWLGAAAVKTNKIRIGTGLTCPILRYNPAIIAQAAEPWPASRPSRRAIGRTPISTARTSRGRICATSALYSAMSRSGT